MAIGQWLRCSVNFVVSIALGILFGLGEAALWLLRVFIHVRDVIPFAAVDALVIFGLTALITGILASVRNIGDLNVFLNICISRFVTVIMIAAAIFLIFVQIFFGIDLSPTAKAIFSFIGGISFWVMLTTFIGYIFSIVKRI